MTHNDPLVVAVDRWLEAKKSQLWAHHSIAKPEDRWAAAVWFAEEMRKFAGYKREAR